MLTLVVLDKNGHSKIVQNIAAEFNRLIKAGYAAFLNDTQITELPESGEVLMLAPLAGG